MPISTPPFKYINDIHHREKTKTTTTKQRSLRLEQAAYICQNIRTKIIIQSFIHANHF